jgi:hypothetical protein
MKTPASVSRGWPKYNKPRVSSTCLGPFFVPQAAKADGHFIFAVNLSI